MAKPAKIKAVKLFWASTAEPNPMSGKFQVDIADLRKDTVEKLEGLGVDVNNKGDERGYFVTCKSQYPIDCYDTEGSPIKGNVIGNESVGDVVVTPYPWKFRNKEGVNLGISKIVVTDLQAYEAVDSIDMNDLEEL